ncbi:MAG: fimbrial protein [Stenotrophomonas sp.]|uniref:fimbrial protein n=1 Tax=Stenotrophomonas sp. TaxID=69392 RepID=UPI002FC5B001
MRVVLLLAALNLLLPLTSQAADLTLRFTGRFQPGTCQISVADVDVGTFDAPYFTANPQSPAVGFTLSRSGCGSDLRVLHIRMAGAADGSDPRYFAIPAAGGVRGLAVWLYTPAQQTLAPNQAGFDWLTSGTPAAGHLLYARLVRTGTVSAGTLRAPVTVQVTYN